jgi:hypothetical protein
MTGALMPVLKGIYVCDDVVGNPAGGKPMIVNLWDTRWVTPTEAFPVRVAKLCVFAWIRGGRGRLTFRVHVVGARTGEVIGSSPPHELNLTHPNLSVYAKFMITDFPFPEPGRYFVELFCEGEFLDDQPIQIRVRSEGSS